MSELRFLTAGESHGPGLTAILEGLSAGFTLNRDAINHQLWRRQQGYGRGGRMKIESDQIQILSGLRGGKTLGSPLTLHIPNKDFENRRQTMDPWEPSADTPVTLPRPGHADFAGAVKYGADDIRNILERASARETAIRVAAGAVCRQFLEKLGISLQSRVLQIGPEKDLRFFPDEANFIDTDTSPVRCNDGAASAEMVAAIQAAQKEGVSIGGIFQIAIFSAPVGLGSHVHWERRLDSQIAAQILSIPAIKGIEFGLGFQQAALTGEKVHDPFNEKSRDSNNAGGVEGGISNGMPIWFQAVMKPIPTLTKALNSRDIVSGEIAPAFKERTDACAVPAAAVIAENLIAIPLLQEIQRKFGGDHWNELYERYIR
jgi:chorismate synthase